MTKVKLSDGTEYEVLFFSVAPTFRIYAETPAEMMAIWNKMTHENTEVIEYYEDDVKKSVHQNCCLTRLEVSQDAKYEQCYGTFYFVGEMMPYTDPEYKAAYHILTGEE